MDEMPVWSERVHVRAWEVGPENEAGVPALCNWLQEAAGNHASALEWGMDNLHDRDLTWVLARLHVHMERLPAWREELLLSTWPTGVQRVLAIRDFSVQADGTSLAVATSGWVLLDTTTRRPVRPGPALQALAARTPPRALHDPFERLPELKDITRRVNVRVGRSDLDLNGHANNARFVAWALDALPGEVVRGRIPRDFEIELRAEAREGDTLAVEVFGSDASPDVWLHRVVRPADDKELARARTTFRPRGASADQTLAIDTKGGPQ